MRKLKLTLAIALLAALFLPLSKCSRGGKAAPSAPPPKSFAQQIFPRSDAQTDYDYGFKHLRPSLHGLVSLVAFGWPLVLALLNRRAAGKRGGRWPGPDRSPNAPVWGVGAGRASAS